MATEVVDLELVRQQVLAELRKHPRRPIELLDALGQDYPDAAIKEVVLRLLRDESIKMEADRRLRIEEAA